MTHDISQYEETTETNPSSETPLCLIHYIAEREEQPPEQNSHPPGRGEQGRLVEQRANLILVEFAEPLAKPALKPGTTRKQWQGVRSRKSVLERTCNILLALLLLACFAACVAAFRF